MEENHNIMMEQWNKERNKEKHPCYGELTIGDINDVQVIINGHRYNLS